MGVIRIGNQLIQSGWENKDSITIGIRFPVRFGGTPVVIVTSSWPNAPVSYVETVFEVTPIGFNVHSANVAWNYFVNWIAIGTASSFAPLSREMEDAISAFKQLDQISEASATEESYDQSSDQPKN